MLTLNICCNPITISFLWSLPAECYVCMFFYRPDQDKRNHLYCSIICKFFFGGSAFQSQNQGYQFRSFHLRQKPWSISFFYFRRYLRRQMLQSRHGSGAKETGPEGVRFAPSAQFKVVARTTQFHSHNIAKWVPITCLARV